MKRFAIIMMAAWMMCGCAVTDRKCTGPEHEWGKWDGALNNMAMDNTLVKQSRTCKTCGLIQSEWHK